MTTISWEQFAIMNIDARGLRLKFEDLCRQLFINEFLSSNSGMRYVHCNPNNPGIESDPVFDEKNNRWIGYQAKYFDSKVGYDQILKSAKATVDYYLGKVDKVYLYSNKPLSVSAANFVAAEKILNDNGITLELVTDVSVLDLVRKYPYLASYYFGTHGMNGDWIKDHNRHMLDALGDRYNAVFNVDTKFANQLSLFVRDNYALQILNRKKSELMETVDKLYWRRPCYQPYLNKIREFVTKLDDVDYEGIELAYLWYTDLTDLIKGDLEQFKAEIEELKNKRSELQDSMKDSTSALIERYNHTFIELNRINDEIDALESLIELPNILLCTDLECRLIGQNVLFVTGEAGIGKSQLLANKVKELAECGRDSLLLLGGLYYTDEPIQNQIADKCDLKLSFSEIMDDLEARAEAQQKIIPIFIDALNETWNIALWKEYLPLLVEAIQKHNHLKLVVSFRDEYSKQILSDSLLNSIQNQEFCQICHEGFKYNTIDATRQFLNHYGIPFTPYEFLEYKMENPLFLTLYCRTYDGSEVDLPVLYERLISTANKNICKKIEKLLRDKGYRGDEDLLTSLIDSMAEIMINNGYRSIGMKDIQGMPYWIEHGLIAAPFIQMLEDERILIDYESDDQKRFYFAYDQMNDYFCARTVLNRSNNKEDVRDWISKNILRIENGEFIEYGNRDLFVNLCLLYEERYGESCIDMIDEIPDEYEKDGIRDKYFESYLWRNRHQIDKSKFLEFLSSNSISLFTLREVLIGNSIKFGHPLNAEFLHSFLMNFDLNKRDYLWTAGINGIFSDDSNRITQLVTIYASGEKLELKDHGHIELLLTLFGWFLTSSNRSFRDYTSKAMVEILKDDFDFCECILKSFEKVNDPYVFQRLYGVVFGACCKCGDYTYDQFESLAEYVYGTIFDKDEVYPDILLRDYARLIVEKFLHESPDYVGCIDRNKIVPPYNSAPIPAVNKDYTKGKYTGGLNSIYFSMRFENMGMYGDFGRYVFQSALHDFDVDLINIFNYSMSFIINELGYKADWFDDFDKHVSRWNYNRHNTMKTERIGKKYQWIAMYNILARVTDNCKMRDPYTWEDEAALTFEGAWEPYVRDFDPTLNSNFMFCSEAPYFQQKDQYISLAQNEIRNALMDKDFSKKAWLKTEDAFLRNLNEVLLLKDAEGKEWVLLTTYVQTKEGIPVSEPYSWCWLYAYFVSPDQEKHLIECAEKNLKLPLYIIYSHNETYAIFNREFPWSPACASFRDHEWVDVRVEVKEKNTKTDEWDDETMARIGSSLAQYAGKHLAEESVIEVAANFSVDDICDKGNSKLNLAEKHNSDMEIGKILHASSDLMWEEEFDASKEETICWSVPCSDFIQTEGLQQLELDGFFFDKDGELAAFDTALTQNGRGVAVRKDLLDDFLVKRDLRLLWFTQADKEYHVSDTTISEWSEWDGLLQYDGEKVHGDIRLSKVNP